MSDEKRVPILFVLASDSVFRRFGPMTNRTDVEVKRVRSGQHGLTLAQSFRSRLIICQYPMPDLTLDEFLRGVRAGESASICTPVLVLTRRDRREVVENALKDEGTRVACVDDEPKELQRALYEIIGVAMRAHMRLMVETQVEIEGENTLRVFQTENISETGFLVRSSVFFPVGCRVQFALTLPSRQKTVSGVAEVVRHAQPANESIKGMAMRMLSFKGDGQKRLAEFIEEQSARARGANGHRLAVAS